MQQLRPPIEIDLEHQLDGFTVSLPMPERFSPWFVVAMVATSLAIIAGSIIGGVALGLEDALAIILILGAIPTCVGGAIAIDRWLMARTRAVSLRGQRLTLTNGRRQRALDLTEVAEVDNSALDVALVLRSGERLLIAKGQSYPVQKWLTETIRLKLARPAVGTPDEVPAAMRVLTQKQPQPQ